MSHDETRKPTHFLIDIALPTVILVALAVPVLRASKAASVPLGNGDANGDGQIDVGDVSYLLSFMFQGGAEPAQLVPTSESVPIGTVIDWLPSDPGAVIPDGFLLCDGSVIDDPLSPYDGATLPDLVGRYVDGMSQVWPPGQAITGSTSHAHSHSHLMSVPNPVTHANHTHTWATFNAGSLQWFSGDGEALIDYTNGIDTPGSGYYPISMFPGPPNATFGTGPGNLGAHTVASSSGMADSTSTESQPHEPPYLTTAKIMRVR